MTKKLAWTHSTTGEIDGLQLFDITGSGYGSQYSPFTLHTSLPVGGKTVYRGQVVALENITSKEAAQSKAQEVLDQFAATLEEGSITWRPGSLVWPAVGVVGGINLFRIYSLPGRTLLRSRLPIAPGGVAQGDLANVEAAKVKAEQMMDQFAHHVGIDFSKTA